MTIENTEITNDNVEQIYNEITNPQANEEVEVEAPVEPEYEYTANGKPIKEPLSMILKRAAQGYDYANKMGEWNKKNSEWTRKEQEYQKQLAEAKKYRETYAPVDEYATKNADWWNHVNQQYQLALRGQNPAAQTPSEIAALKAELDEIKGFVNETLQEKQERMQREADSQLDNEIKSIRDQYPNLDFNSYDSEGRNLEWRILDHAQKIGASSFRVAFRDYYHENLLNSAKEKGKETVVNEQKKALKFGLLGKSSTPTKVINDAKNVKSKSYDDLLQESLKELNL